MRTRTTTAWCTHVKTKTLSNAANSGTYNHTVNLLLGSWNSDRHPTFYEHVGAVRVPENNSCIHGVVVGADVQTDAAHSTHFAFADGVKESTMMDGWMDG